MSGELKGRGEVATGKGAEKEIGVKLFMDGALELGFLG